MRQMKRMKRKLTPLQKLIRRKYTKRDKYNNVWLVIDPQWFQFQNCCGREDKQHQEWIRDQLSIALELMAKQIVETVPV